MRIASLVPSATEMLFALGLGDQVVAVTHECDYPPEATAKRHLTPSLGRLESKPEVISLDPDDLGEVLDDLDRLGEATGSSERAAELRGELEGRLADVRAAVAGARRPRVLPLEWLDPPFTGGHWVPEMIEMAGGDPLLCVRGGKCPTASWEEIAASQPDVVVAMPCGWDAQQARTEVETHSEQVKATGAETIWAVDGAASFSRPGPRLVDGTELLAHLLHPDRVGAPSGVPFERIEEKTWA